MSADLYKNLRWLPRPPDDFRSRCRALGDDDAPSVLRHLASFALDDAQLRHLANAVARLRAGGTALSPLTPFTLGIVGNATLEPLLPVLTATALRHGLDLTCIAADFGQTLAEATAPDSAINRARPDAVLIALDHRGLPFAVPTLGTSASGDAAGDSLAFVDALRNGFRAHAGALSIVQTVAPPPETLFGSFDPSVAGTVQSAVARFNAALPARIAGSGDLLLDVAHLASTVGLAEWHAATQWNMAKFAFDAAFLPLYADHVCRLLGALRGKSRRCLILDLDNTIWGGVIGDDGIEGIVLAQGDATGEAYLEVQRLASALRRRGIVLAVSSKNEDAVAREPFRNHPDMLLREDDIAVFQANWQDKATNVAAIAEALSLGQDAMVFLDDNPVERGQVREALPAVAVPELPADPALFARTLAAAGYFEAVAFSEEDRKRADFYAGNARRVALAAQVGDLESYLVSLGMKIVFRPFDATGRSRIAQLIGKSNQFNLTTRRYTESDVAVLESDATVFTLAVRLLDAFGDNGMIAVVICRPSGDDAWEIDTWLMSCRVLGRRVEQAMLREIVQQARARGIRRLVGRYIPTARNAMVAAHYEKLGFRPLGGEPPGETAWELETGVEIAPAPMDVERLGYDVVIA